MTKSTDIDLYLVRAGRTEWDEEGRLQGRSDMRMTVAGGAALAASLRHLLVQAGGVDLATVHSGSDESSAASAQMLADLTGAKVRPHKTLDGANLGLWEGLRESDLLERFGSAYRQWRDDPAAINPPGGETLLDLEIRLMQTLVKIADKAGPKGVGVVLRPLSYGLLRARLADRPTSDIWQLVEDGPMSERHHIPRTRLRTLLEQLKART